MHAGAAFDDLLSLDDVDALISGGSLRRPALRLVCDGDPVPPARWTKRVRTGSVTIDDVADAARVLDLHADGATIVLQSLHRWWPPLTAFARALERELGHAVQANAYLTPPGATGLAPHHDTHDVFVLQVHGTKHWTVREALVVDPLTSHRSRRDEAADQPIRFEVELVPGSCLYLPRGAIHSARSMAGSSLHVTVGVLATTVHDVVRRVAAIAADVPALRKPLPPGWASDPAIGEQAVKDALVELVRMIDVIEPREVVEHLARGFHARRAPDERGRLNDLDRVASLTATDRVSPRPGVPLTILAAGDRMRITTGPRTLDLPAVVAPAVTRLLDGRACTASDLGDLLDDASALVLVRRLVREGLLALADPPSDAGA